ncbi:serine/threonine-protein kinase [Streptomyces sp. WMMC500]|uniref:serine/threonine-protein kinase n=1 Tax=Streptomyces sp. WMMC500 TaxID=3015154 RepID=UPI00248B2F09|nr:serine/threonine-protein kinase [Streptomyces sp. WMMC500]WBB63673.1 serine/threonine-protein kinase [Streptomyces sp. WMMC500]
MTDEGDKVGDEPTSYGLRPPQQNAEGAGPDAAATQVVADPATGRLIGGRYRLAARLGVGGMGTVWRAHDEVVDRDVAVKEPRLPADLDERTRQTAYERMQREARAAARIDHPSVVTVHDVVMEEGRPWIVMELVRGRSLGDQLTEGTLDPREVARIGGAVLGALTAAHEAGILHRDVKPDNVLLGRHGRVVLTDFGIAQIEGEQGLTETGAFVGSPEYIAPERVLGQRPGPESDLWSLGVVMYAAVEGMSPYRRQTAPATLQAVLSAEPAAPARGSGALGTVVMQLLRKDPAARPAPDEVRRQLEAVARPVPAQTMIAPVAGGGAGGGRGGRLGAALPKGRGGRLAVLGGAVAVAAALVLALVNPFGGDDAPAGWKTYEETEQLKASLAVPEDYKRSVDEGTVSFKDPGGMPSLWITRSPDVEESALSEANASLKCDRGDNLECTELSTDVEGTVKEYDYRGEDAAQMDETWTHDEGYETEAELRSLEFFYVNDDGIGWHLTVEMPAAGEGKRDGERVFREVVDSLDIQDR